MEQKGDGSVLAGGEHWMIAAEGEGDHVDRQRVHIEITWRTRNEGRTQEGMEIRSGGLSKTTKLRPQATIKDREISQNSV